MAAPGNKLVVIPFENQSYDDIVGSSQAPYLNHLISQGTVFTQYSAIVSGSNPNYLAMTSGLTTALTPPSPNVFQAIDGSIGVTWKEFMESMTGTCGAGTAGLVPGSTDTLYTTDHDPAWAYQANTTCSTNDVPLTSSSFSNLPSFSFMVPNECNDMHTLLPAGQSCPAFFGSNSGTSQINIGDNWLSTVVPMLLAQSNVTVLITWDENSGTGGAGPFEHIVTLQVGAGVTVGGIDGNSYNHYSLEAGIYRYFGLGTAPNNGASVLPLPIPASGAPPYPGPSNAITVENSNPGTTAWLLGQQADGYNQQIDGYASATSVNLGQQITFYVSVNARQNFTMDFFRMGYYQGLGGRFMLDVPNLAGVVQPNCPVSSTTGLIVCNWAPSYQLTIPTTWVSGVYLAKLTNAAGYQNFVIFVVRDDARSSALLYQVAFNTYAAYNNFPNDVQPGSTTGLPLTGKSLYDFNSSSTLTALGTQRAVQVSLDRPFADDGGAGGFLNYEVNDVAWLEQQGYDVSYSSDVDTDLSGSNLLNHHAFISAGHDEYWSMAMYNAAANARDHGVNLAFLGADDVSWQVRYGASSSGAADRIVICYKSATLDPVQNNTVTVHFRDPQVNLPEQLLVGGTSAGEQLGASNATPVAYIVQNSSNWVYANTGAFNGESIPNVVGYEIDASNSTFPAPTAAAGTYQLLSSSPITNTNNTTVYQNSTIYQAASGAWVFSAAAIEWGWSLFDFGFATGGQSHPNYSQSFVQIMTANVLNRFSAGFSPLPGAPTNLVAVPSPSSVSLSWTDTDASATYELDRSSNPAFDTFTSVGLPAGTTTYSDAGLGSSVYYYRLVAVGANGKSPYVSASAATMSYAALVAGRAGLLAHWRMGESSGSTAFDTTGTYNGTYVNSPTLGSPGAIVNDPNTCVSFNGSTQRVSIPAVPSVSDFTIEGWSYLTNASVNNNTLYGGSGTARLMPRPGTGGFPTAAYAGVTLNGTEYALQPNSPASNINTWVYWVLTRQGGQLTLYRNGVQIAQRSDLPATATASISGFIGAQNNGAYYLTGSLQDVALYTQALSSTDVRNGYATALNGIAPTPPPVAPTNFIAVPSASAVSLYWTDGDTTSGYFLYRSTDPSFATAVTLLLPPGTTRYTDTGLGLAVVYYRLLAANSSGRSPYLSATAATFSYASLVAGRTGLLGHWRLGEASGTTAWDTTGTYNGFYVSGPTLGSPGAIGNDPNTSVMFNGTTQRVNLPALPSGGDFTVEGWSYLTSGSVNNNTLYGGISVQLLPRPGTGSFPTAAYAAVTLNGSVYALQPTSPASNLNTWVYWVLARQGGTLTLYRNGVQIAQRTDLPATATTSLSGYIADESGGSYYLTGRVQDVAVYSRALSGAEATSSYTVALNGLAPAPAPAPSTPYYSAVRSEPSLIAYWRLGETSGSTAVDVLGTHNGTYVGGPTLGSAGAIVNDPDRSVTFNGTSQQVNLPSIPAVGDFTIEGWSYLTNPSVNNNAVYGGPSTVQLLARPGTGGFPTAAFAGVTLNGTSYVLQPNSPGSNINNWVYWTLTRQGGTLTLYRNGVQIGQRTDLPATATANISGYIADESGGLYYLAGGIDEVAVYGSALTPQDITSHYQDAQFGPAPAPNAPPTVAVANPVNATTYGANWTGSVNGTASTNSGFPLVAVSVAVQDSTTGQWWGGSAFDQAGQTFVPVTSGTTNWSLTFAATNLSSGHSYVVTARATDSVGNTGTGSPVGFTYNVSPPSVAVSYPTNGTVYGANWSGTISGSASSNSGFALTGVTVAVQDTTTGLWWGGAGFNQAAQTFVAVSSSPTSWSLNFPAANLTSGHGYTVTPRAVDSLGNIGTGGSVAFSYYTTAPVTTVACNGTACASGWYTAPVSVTLSAADPGGPGVTATYFTTDGSTPTTSSTLYAGAFTVSTSATVKFFSVDSAGNTESVRSQLIKVDNGTPTTTIACNGSTCSSSWYTSPVSVTLSATDTGGSGLNGTYYTTDGSTPNTSSTLYTTAFMVSSSATVKFFSVDSAGNAESVNSQVIQVDGTPPTTTIVCNGTTCSSSWYSGPVTVTLSAGDNSGGAGVLATYYTTDGSNPATSGTLYSGSFTVSSSSNTVKFFSVDNAGNSEPVSSQFIQIATGTPITTIACNGSACSGGWYTSPVGVTLSAVDPGGPGVSATYYTTDGSTPTTSSTLYTGAFTVPSSATVKFFSVDNSGNAEPVNSQPIQVFALVSIAVTPANPSIGKGTTQQFTATGTYSDGSTQDLTNSATWLSSDVAVANITSGGLATGAGQGTSQVSAVVGGITGSTTLSVGPAVVVSVVVTPGNPSIAKGTTQQFTATGTYSDGSTADLTSTVAWLSSNTAVASVTAGGLASGVAQGTSQISASVGGITGGTTLTVAPAALVSIALTPANPSIAKGTTQQFTATGTYSDGSTQDLTNSATWLSSNAAVATITAGGLAGGVAQGTSQIGATVGSVTGSTTLTVGPAAMVSIAVTPANPSIAKGTTQQFTATGTYSDGSTADLTSTVAWLSSNTTVATVAAGGLASGVAPGSVQLSATAGSVTGGTTLTVGPAALVSIALTPASPTIAQGKMQQFSATAAYSDGTLVDVTSSSTWASSTMAVATIAAGGLATGLAQGSSQISATLGGVAGSTTLKVGPVVLTSIAVTPANPTIAKGTTQQFTATGTYSDGSTQNLTGFVTWASSNAAVAAITAGGLATAAGQGTSQISASWVGVTGSTTLSVGAARLLSLAVTPVNPTIAKGSTQQFIATGTYSDGSTSNLTSTVTWTSSNTKVATIAAGGLATAVAKGTSTISASSAGVTGRITLTVSAATLVSIVVTPANPSIAKGSTKQFSATGTYSDGTTKNLTTSVSWASSNTAVATITAGGLASGVGLGTSEITATTSGVTGSTTLTVGTATLVSIAVAPANPSIAKGTTQQFTATGTYADGSTQNLTYSAAWASSSIAVAKITAGGLATGVAQGTSQISASTAGITGSTTLTVGPAVLVSIAVTPTNPTIAKGTTQQFTATGTYSDGSTLDLTSAATWVSSNSGVATVTAVGLATGVAQGTSPISASAAGVTGSTTLTVGPAKLVSITVTPSGQFVKVGTTVQYTAIGTYSDGSTQDLTASVTWASSSPTVATITSAGTTTSLNVGSTTISATLGSTVGSTSLNVTN